MGDIQAQGRVFADDEKYTRTATEAIQGLSGAMSVGVGVASLFGASQENLAKIQMHLQSVMAISIGVNQVAQVLNKDSYVSHILLAKAKAMVASATNRLSLALGVSNVAAKALMATLTLGLSVAITAVVWAVDKMISSSDEAQRKQKELAEQAAQTQQQFNDSVATNVAKQIVSLKKLQDQWSKLSRFDERLKFVRDNKTAFDELGVSITSVQDAENLLVKNTDAFIASVKAKALSLAYTDLATAEYQNVVKKQLQKEQRQKTITDDDRQVGYDNLNSQYVGKGALSRGAVSRNKDKYIAQGIKKSQDAAVAVIQTEIDDSLKKVDDFFNASKELFDKHTNALLESGIKTNDSQTNQVSASSKPTAADSTKAFEARIEAERKLKEALVNMQFDTEQARIDVLADGLDKELAQIELNYTKKQTAIELWEREQRQIVVDAQKTTFIAQGGKEQDFKVDGSDPAFVPINKSYDAKTAANNAEQTASNEKLLTDLKTQWQTWADDYQQIEDQITATRANADRDRQSIAAAHKAGKIDSTEAMTATRKVDSGEQKQIANLESQKTKLSSSWEQVFRDLQGMSRSQVKILISEINDQLSNSELSPADHSALLEQLDKAKDYATTLNPFASFVDGINDVKTATELLGKAKQALEATKTTDTPEQEKKAAEQAVKKAEKALADTKKDRNEAASKSLGDISGMASATSDLLKTFGVESPAVDGVVGALGSLASIDFTNAMSIITGGLGAIANLLGGIFGEVDKRKEQQIADIQRTVDSITESYDKLDKAIGKAYSNDAADLIGDEIKMREQQRGLIEQQKKIEESRKNPDDGALEGYDKAIDDINLKIEESKEAACDAIFGSDVQSAIDEFASAYMNSWASGEDRAQSQKDVVKNMLRGIIKEMLKADIKGSVEKMRKQIEGFMSDDVLSELELSQIDKIGDEIGHIMEERGKIYDKILKDDKPIDKDETSLSGQIRGTVATEQSVSELGGIFRGMADTGRRIEIGLDLGFKTVAEMARTQLLIEANTRRSADNTDGLTSKIDATNTKLDTLISKIKPDNGSY